MSGGGVTHHALVLCGFLLGIFEQKVPNSILDQHLGLFGTGFRQRKGDFPYLKQWWDHGNTEIKLLRQQHILNVPGHVTGSIRDLEAAIVELEPLNESTGNRGSIKILTTKKTALAYPLLAARHRTGEDQEESCQSNTSLWDSDFKEREEC